jgi:uncharacterized membrane protein YkoI
MKSTFKILTVAATLVAACDSGSPDDAGVPEADARRVAEDAVGGTALSAELVRDAAPPHWSVDVEMANGGEIEAKVHADEGELIELEAFAGPFDYAFTPVDGVLSYTEMMAAALEEIEGEVEAWKFEAEGGEFEFEFYVRATDGQLWEIKFDAQGGAAKDIEQVDEVHE